MLNFFALFQLLLELVTEISIVGVFITPEPLWFIKIFPKIIHPGMKLLSIYIRVCTYAPLSRPNCRTNLHQILYRPPHQLREGSFYINDTANLTP